MDMTKVNDWLSAIPSPHTRKSYKAGIRKFEKFYGKGIETLIEKSNRETGKIIEKFYVWLKEKGHGQNTCRNLVNSPIQFLKFFGNEPRYRKSLGIYKTVRTTRDHRATIQEIQEMAKVADLREQILLETYLLGLRIGDVSNLQWRTFDVKGEYPIPIQIMTRKEEVVARSFITEEFKNLLEKYLPLLDKSNKYLFQSKRKLHLSNKQINNIFKNLVKRAGIENHGLFRWHTGRKLVLRTCAELGISSWSAKLIVGKSIPASDDTYIHDANLKNDFKKISDVLRLFPKTIPQAEDKLKNLENALRHVEEENAVSKTRIDMLQKDLRSLKETVEKLYPKEVKHYILDEKNEVEEYTENFENPEEYLESQRKFMRAVLLRNKRKKERERLKNAEFVFDRTGKMSKEEIVTEAQKLRKQKKK
jgi:integrase